MLDSTPELQAKFKQFRDCYEWALVWLANTGCTAEELERHAWASTEIKMPLSEIEERLFRVWLMEDQTPASTHVPHQQPGPIPKPD
jgi:hypothetical protein